MSTKTTPHYITRNGRIFPELVALQCYVLISRLVCLALFPHSSLSRATWRSGEKLQLPCSQNVTTLQYCRFARLTKEHRVYLSRFHVFYSRVCNKYQGHCGKCCISLISTCDSNYSVFSLTDRRAFDPMLISGSNQGRCIDRWVVIINLSLLLSNYEFVSFAMIQRYPC